MDFATPWIVSCSMCIEDANKLRPTATAHHLSISVSDSIKMSDLETEI